MNTYYPLVRFWAALHKARQALAAARKAKKGGVAALEGELERLRREQKHERKMLKAHGGYETVPTIHTRRLGPGRTRGIAGLRARSGGRRARFYLRHLDGRAHK